MKTKFYTIFKNRFFLILMLVSGFSGLLAQSGVTNLSFESWTVTTYGNAPTGWFGFGLSKQTTGAQQGSNYVRIANSSSITGVLMLGVPTSTNFMGGAPYNARPTSVSGFYKTSGLVAGDTVGISAYTSKSSSLTSYGTIDIGGNAGNWTSFAMTMYSVAAGCDSIFIVATSDYFGTGTHTNSPNATLDLDNLTITAPVGLDERSLNTAFLVYPNPATSELNIASKDESARQVRISDISGRLISETVIESENTRLDLRSYQGGIYFYTICDSKGSVLLSSRFVVIR